MTSHGLLICTKCHRLDRGDRHFWSCRHVAIDYRKIHKEWPLRFIRHYFKHDQNT